MFLNNRARTVSDQQPLQLLVFRAQSDELPTMTTVLATDLCGGNVMHPRWSGASPVPHLAHSIHTAHNARLDPWED